MTFQTEAFKYGRTVPAPDSSLQRHIGALAKAFPVAAEHQDALRLVGSSFVDARPRGEVSERGAWTALIRFGGVIESTFGFTREILVYYSNHLDLQLRDYERLPSVRKDPTIPRRVEPSLYFISSPDPQAATKLDRWTEREAFSAVSLPGLRGDALVTAEQIVSGLTRRVSRRNRYDQTLPVTGDDFFGRTSLLNDLADQLRQGKVCGIFGLRKTGKTSFVKELGHRFQLSGPDERVFILRDLEDLPSSPGDHIPDLLMNLRQSLLPELRRRELRTHELANLSGGPSLGDFRRALQATLGHSSAKNVQIVLALDEVESLVGPSSSHSSERPHVPELLGVLRSLVQENQNFNVVVSGLTSAILEKGLMYGRENPLFAWAKPYYMPPLPIEEANELVAKIGERMAMRWTSDALETLFETTGGHVFLHRTLCANIADALPSDLSDREITRERVLAARRRWRRGMAEQLQEMIRSLSRFYPAEADVLRLISSGSLNVGEADDAFPSEVHRLINLGLLEEEGVELRTTRFSNLALGLLGAR